MVCIKLDEFVKWKWPIIFWPYWICDIIFTGFIMGNWLIFFSRVFRFIKHRSMGLEVAGLFWVSFCSTLVMIGLSLFFLGIILYIEKEIDYLLLASIGANILFPFIMLFLTIIHRRKVVRFMMLISGTISSRDHSDVDWESSIGTGNVDDLNEPNDNSKGPKMERIVMSPKPLSFPLYLVLSKFDSLYFYWFEI